MTNEEHLDRIARLLDQIMNHVNVSRDELEPAMESLTALREHFSSDGAAERVLRDPGFVASSREDALVDRIHANADTAFRTELQLHEEIAALRASIAEMERKQGSPSTDTELEKIADEIGAAIEPSGFWDVDRGVILAAIKSVRAAEPTPHTDAAAPPPEPRS